MELRQKADIPGGGCGVVGHLLSVSTSLARATQNHVTTQTPLESTSRTSEQRWCVQWPCKGGIIYR